MRHIHKQTRQEYEVSKLIDFDGSSYDIIIITKWPDYASDDELDSPKLIGYYFGEYTITDTDDYINRYLKYGNPNS